MLHANRWSQLYSGCNVVKGDHCSDTELIQLFVSFISVNYRDNKLACQICFLKGGILSGLGELYKIWPSLTTKVCKLKDFNVA